MRPATFQHIGVTAQRSSKAPPNAIILERSDPGTGASAEATTFPVLGREARPKSDASRSRHGRLKELEFVNKELRHRLQNFIPLVMSMMKLTAERSQTLADFRDALEGRLRAIANVEAMRRTGLDRCSLEDLVRIELTPYARIDQFDVGGPWLGLRTDIAQSMSMIIHELTTNAVKHGGLSCPSGSVIVRWSVERCDLSHATLCFSWIERGGPPAAAQFSKRGFGTTILCDEGKAITGGTSKLKLSPDGLLYLLTTRFER
jgi:two-component sensor histidine kinase